MTTTATRTRTVVSLGEVLSYPELLMLRDRAANILAGCPDTETENDAAFERLRDRLGTYRLDEVGLRAMLAGLNLVLASMAPTSEDGVSS
jgi:hypothetical protein